MANFDTIPTTQHRQGPRLGCFGLAAVLLLVLFAAQSTARLIVEYAWWTELGQQQTWQSLLIYSVAPVALGALLVFAVLWVVHARALKFAGTGLREQRAYAVAATLALAFIALIIALATLDSWITVSYFGSLRAGLGANTWTDPVFGRPLSFYFFKLPFLEQLVGLLLATTIVASLVFYLTSKGWQLARQRYRWGEPVSIDPSDWKLEGAMESVLLRGLLVVALLTIAVRAYLARYDLLFADHGFLVGIDYLAHWFGLPLQWALVAASVVAAVFVSLGKWRWIGLVAAVLLVRAIVPPLVSAIYVKPNELGLQRSYIRDHINATRSAFGLQQDLTEVEYPAVLERPIDVAKVRPLVDNVRLWDWSAFHDTVSQIQALRQYYSFADSDVDRYVIDGELRQVLLTPRELDIRQLPEARLNWINTHLIYTHGYGVVMADANRISSTGQPLLFIQDAPPRISTDSLKLTRPELYYGEVTHEPVFVMTDQPEFNYPAGSDNVHTKYAGKGGIPIGGAGMRLAAGVATADRNLLLSGYINGQSRMMIHRNVRDRVSTLAGFLQWDNDPYLVISRDGRLVWILDGFTTSARHPYSRRVQIGGRQVSYMRNAVKATVDAYDGTVRIYVFEPDDPIIRAFDAMFPSLFVPAEQMPEDLREHVRYPELMFRAQSEMYRTFHMQDPEAFYNREDLWDLARNLHGNSAQAEPVQPMFVLATVPGSATPEFLLVQPFTPRNKDNLIGLMMARSDGEHLGKLVVLQLSKQSLIYGPLQIDARINSDQDISKDLNLWNQQGSQVIRGMMLVLPVEDTIIYIKPIYIQSAQARMPQMKKVAVAMGNTLIYRDTYEEALSALAGAKFQSGETSATPPASGTGPPPATAQQQPAADVTAPGTEGGEAGRLQTARDHLRRYRELTAQGRWAEAGRELESLDKLLGR